MNFELLRAYKGSLQLKITLDVGVNWVILKTQETLELGKGGIYS